MEVRIQVIGGDEPRETAELWEWLRAERGLTGAVHGVQKPPGEGELGGALDVVAVALGSGGAGVVLARSLSAWLRTRRATVTVVVKTKARTVTVNAANLDREDVLPLLEQALQDRDD